MVPKEAEWMIPELETKLGSRWPVVLADGSKLGAWVAYAVSVTSLNSGTAWIVRVTGGISNNLLLDKEGHTPIYDRYGSRMRAGRRMCAQPVVWSPSLELSLGTYRKALPTFYAAQVFALWADEEKMLAVGE